MVQTISAETYLQAYRSLVDRNRLPKTDLYDLPKGWGVDWESYTQGMLVAINFEGIDELYKEIGDVKLSDLNEEQKERYTACFRMVCAPKFRTMVRLMVKEVRKTYRPGLPWTQSVVK